MKSNPQSTPLMSVIIPVYNNLTTITKLKELLEKTLKQISYNFEIIFIDDNSVDGSTDLLKTIPQNDQLKIIFNSQNLGQHPSIFRGIEKCSGEYIVVMDADLQDRPELIPKLYYEIKKGYDSVFAKRKGIYQKSSRMISSKILKSMVYVLTGLSVAAGTYFITKASVAKAALRVNCSHPYSTIIIAILSKKIGYIENKRQPNQTNKSSYTFKKRIRQAYYALHCALFVKFKYLKEKRYVF